MFKSQNHHVNPTNFKLYSSASSGPSCFLASSRHGAQVAVVVVPDINKLLPWRGSPLTVGLERLISGLVLLCRVGLNMSWSGWEEVYVHNTDERITSESANHIGLLFITKYLIIQWGKCALKGACSPPPQSDFRSVGNTAVFLTWSLCGRRCSCSFCCSKVRSL